jgi:quercetin dioxygenase-like cupin family protein
MVLSGTFRFLLNEMVYNMQAGDSFFYHTVLPFSALCTGDDSGEVIWVLTPALP